jgi:hypothetical protein
MRFVVAAIFLAACQRDEPAKVARVAPSPPSPLAIKRQRRDECRYAYEDSMRLAEVKKLALTDKPCVLDEKPFLTRIMTAASPELVMDSCEKRDQLQAVLWVSRSDTEHVSGYAAVFDYRAARLICAGPIDVASQKKDNRLYLEPDLVKNEWRPMRASDMSELEQRALTTQLKVVKR